MLFSCKIAGNFRFSFGARISLKRRQIVILRGVYDNSAEFYISVYAAQVVSLYFESPPFCMKTCTKILDNLFRLEKKTTMLGGGGRII